MAKRKTAENWERNLNVSLTKSFSKDAKKVEILKCSICEEFSTRIQSIAGFSESWVNGTTSVKLDSLKKHLQGRAHQHAKQLFDRKKLGDKFVTQT